MLNGTTETDILGITLVLGKINRFFLLLTQKTPMYKYSSDILNLDLFIIYKYIKDCSTLSSLEIHTSISFCSQLITPTQRCYWLF